MRVAICFAARIVCSASSRSSPPAGNVTATAAIGCSRVVEHRGRDAGQTRA